MRCVVAVEVSLLSEAELKEQVADLAELVARQNRLFIRKLGRRRIPELYKSGLVYRPDPWDGSFQHFPHCLTLLQRGFVDCKGAVPWQLADLRERYPDQIFGVHSYVKKRRDGLLDVHLQVKHPSGEIEDPSRLLHQ